MRSYQPNKLLVSGFVDVLEPLSIQPLGISFRRKDSIKLMPIPIETPFPITLKNKKLMFTQTNKPSGVLGRFLLASK